MAAATGPVAVLTFEYVLTSKTARCYVHWSIKLPSGARKRGRERVAKLPVGVDDLRGRTDAEMVYMLSDELGTYFANRDRPKAPPPPEGGATGGDPLLPLFEADPA